MNFESKNWNWYLITVALACCSFASCEPKLSYYSAGHGHINPTLDSLVVALYSFVPEGSTDESGVVIEDVALFPSRVVELSIVSNIVTSIDTNLIFISGFDFPVFRRDRLCSLYGTCMDLEKVSQHLHSSSRSPFTGSNYPKWTVIIDSIGKFEILNITDTLVKYDFNPSGIVRYNAKIFPCR